MLEKIKRFFTRKKIIGSVVVRNAEWDRLMLGDNSKWFYYIDYKVTGKTVYRVVGLNQYYGMDK